MYRGPFLYLRISLILNFEHVELTTTDRLFNHVTHCSCVSIFLVGYAFADSRLILDAKLACNIYAQTLGSLERAKIQEILNIMFT